MNVRTKVKKFHEEAVLPKYAKPGDAGVDLVAIEDTVIGPGETVIIKTGLGFEIPPMFEMQVRPRSGISVKTKLRVILGTIDSGFRGEVGVIVENVGSEAAMVGKGMRIAQAVLAPVCTAHFVEVDYLGESERGTGGYGSTGVTV